MNITAAKKAAEASPDIVALILDNLQYALPVAALLLLFAASYGKRSLVAKKNQKRAKAAQEPLPPMFSLAPFRGLSAYWREYDTRRVLRIRVSSLLWGIAIGSYALACLIGKFPVNLILLAITVGIVGYLISGAKAFKKKQEEVRDTVFNACAGRYVSLIKKSAASTTLIQEWGPDGLTPTQIRLSIEPTDLKKSDTEHASFQRGFGGVIGSEHDWVFESAATKDGHAAIGRAVRKLPPERARSLRLLADAARKLPSFKGMDSAAAERLVKITAWEGNLPARFIITGVASGESDMDDDERRKFESELSRYIDPDRYWALSWMEFDDNREYCIRGEVRAPLPKGIVGFPDDYIKEEDGEIIDGRPFDHLPVGVSMAGPVSFNLNMAPMFGFFGGTGGGKSVCQRSSLIHCLSRPDQWELYLADPKRLSFGIYRDSFLYEEGKGNVMAVATDFVPMVAMIRNVANIMDDRYKQMEAIGGGLDNIRDMSPALGHPRWRYILLMIDEASDLLGGGGAKDIDEETGEEVEMDPKKKKELMNQVSGDIDRIFKLGRACGVHIAMGTQSSRVADLGGAENGGRIKANLGQKIAMGRMNRQESDMALGNLLATKTPGNIPGRGQFQDKVATVPIHAYFVKPTEIIDLVHRIQTLRGIDLHDWVPNYDGPAGNTYYPLSERPRLIEEWREARRKREEGARSNGVVIEEAKEEGLRAITVEEWNESPDAAVDAMGRNLANGDLLSTVGAFLARGPEAARKERAKKKKRTKKRDEE